MVITYFLSLCETLYFHLYFFTFWQISTIKNKPKTPLTVPICSVPLVCRLDYFDTEENLKTWWFIRRVLDFWGASFFLWLLIRFMDIYSQWIFDKMASSESLSHSEIVEQASCICLISCIIFFFSFWLLWLLWVWNKVWIELNCLCDSGTNNNMKRWGEAIYCHFNNTGLHVLRCSLFVGSLACSQVTCFWFRFMVHVCLCICDAYKKPLCLIINLQEREREKGLHKGECASIKMKLNIYWNLIITSLRLLTK